MFATIYLPNFYLQAAVRHQLLLPGQPVALIEAKEKKPVIIQLNKAAQAAGVCKGMAPSQGLARCLRLAIKIRSPQQETLIGEILLHYAFTLSPYVEATAPGVCTVQFTDQRDLVGKLGRVIEQLSESEIIAKGGIAQTPDTSFLAAHLARPVLEIDNARKFLASLSVDTLAIGLDP